MGRESRVRRVREKRDMLWMKGVVIGLGLLLGSWMAFDGMRALVVGDYVTPSSGEYAGQLGPWAQGLRKVGLEPRSTPIKGTFVAFGLAWWVATLLFALGRPLGLWALGALAVASLWYAPVGTAIAVVELVLLVMLHRRA